jgi:hypothetical protein
MKNGMILFFLAFFVMVSGTGYGKEEKFLGVPLVPGSKEISKSEDRAKMISPLSPEDTLQFYKKTFADLEDIKYRDWKDETYIEDDSNNPWHSVTISKREQEAGTKVVIVKDNWTWIIGTLVLRFLGVFVVLLCLFLGLSASGSVISRLTQSQPSKP